MTEAYQLKITLNNSKPRIWRRILVPADYSFFDLHVAIQDAVGWSDAHLHCFRIAQKGTARPINIEFPNPESRDFWDDDYRDERKEKIADYLGARVKQCQYTYDFGDGWDHMISFERRLPANKSGQRPQCLAGENACPPEDCGGVWGYQDLQKILLNPKHREHREIREWLELEDPKDFNPHHFSPTEVDFREPRAVQREYERGLGLS